MEEVNGEKRKVKSKRDAYLSPFTFHLLSRAGRLRFFAAGSPYQSNFAPTRMIVGPMIDTGKR
jgi:hypothetical protein